MEWTEFKAGIKCIVAGVTSDLGKKELKLENHIEVPNKEADQNGDDQFSMDI